ncbi:MAG: hypothetical protein QMB62_04755, partial [Oscillospiraceae bacterium]
MRKLETAAAAFSLAVFASYYLVPPGLYFAFAGFCALISLAALFLKGDARTRLMLICLSAAVGFSVSYVSYQYKTLPARDLAGTEQAVTLKVTDYPEIYDNYSTVNVRLTGENLPHLTALLYAYGDEINALLPGDIVAAKVRFKSADERYGEEFGGYNA